MSVLDPNKSEEESAIEAAAVAWLCERDEGFSPARLRAFETWRDADLRHAAALARVERGLALLAEMPAVRAPLQARFGRAGVEMRPPAHARFPTRLWAVGLAAALIVGALLWRLPVELDPRIQNYLTQAGVPERVELPDGSVINLNADSEVSVKLTPRERHVTLATGEAHFDVAPDPTRPFVVVAEGVSIRAVGTAFNVRVAAAAVEVLVVEGRVELVREKGGTNPASVTRPLLAAGECVSIGRDDAILRPRIEKADPGLIRQALEWHTRVMSFSDTPLREVVEKFNRRNVTQIVVADADLAARKVGGSFALAQVDAFVRLLEQDGEVVAERRGGNEIVLRRAR